MSGLVLVVALVPEDLHRVVPRLLGLPRSVYLDSSLTDGRGGVIRTSRPIPSW
jgi:hypothetical protein